jgi:hypothetical protein
MEKDYKAKFVFRKGKELITFTKWEDIPEDFEFDNLITFKPDMKVDEHQANINPLSIRKFGHMKKFFSVEETTKWKNRLEKLLEKERNDH